MRVSLSHRSLLTVVEDLHPDRRPRRGIATVYLCVALSAMLALASLAVDFGVVQTVKMQLESAATAAARAAAFDFASGNAAAMREDAVAVVAKNPVVGGAPGAGAIDVETVNWDAGTRTYRRGTGSDNAVLVTLYRTAARGNAVGLVFGKVVGLSTVDVKASVIVTGTRRAAGGFQGLEGITLKNNVFVGSYDPATNRWPTAASAGSEGVLATNGTIGGQKHLRVQGDVLLGPGGSLSGSVTVTGSTQTLADPLPIPTLPAWNPQPNPGGVPQTYTVSSATRLGPGTYWFTSLTINANLTFSGPATLIVNGNVVLNADLTAYDGLPANLTIYQLGTGRTFGDGGANNVDITANVIAPGSDFTVKNNGTFRGAAIFRTITAKNNLDLFYDRSLGPAGGGVRIVQVQ